MAKKQKEMSFLGHLEELRWHLIRSFCAIFIVAIVLFIFQNIVFDKFLLAHLNPDFITYRFFCDTFTKLGIDSSFCSISFTEKLQVLALTQQFMTAVWSSLVLGFIVTFPYILWEIWRFIAPGLHDTERKKASGFIFIASLLFFLGIVFSYYVIVPMSVSFFYGYEITDKIANNFTLNSYISLITNTLIGVAVMFELPVLIFFLSKIGLVTPEFLRKYRKHALVIVLIVAAIITPPDVASQIIVSIPILVLYEISIYISKIVTKKNENGK